MRNKLKQERLKSVLKYDKDSGVFTWLKNENRIKKGTIAGCDDGQGYIRICVDMNIYHAHRLAFLYMDGYFPENDVDHINRKRSDNRWDNLREVSRQCNARNSSIGKNNTSGVIGVVYRKDTKKWHAQININGKHISLGNYVKFKYAVIARWAGEKKYKFQNCNTTSTAFLYLKDNFMIDDNFTLPEDM